MPVLILFFCSGASALIYEVLWSKYFSLMLGSTVQAQTVVLAVFMGGLAIGNRIFGKRSASFHNPLTVYGVLELLIGLYAFLFPRLYKGGDWLFVNAGTLVANTGWLLLLLKLLISLGLLLLPTVLMGGTLPLIATWIQRRPGLEPGARVGIFYATNSLGAVFGAGLAGFVLVQKLGMVSSLEITGLGNLFVGLVAVIMGKRESVEMPVPGEAVRATPGSEPLPEANNALSFGLLVAVTGGVSMGLEVLSARALALIAGGSLQAFSLVLMSFILGIGLGSAAISSSNAARKQGWKTVYFLLVCASTMVIFNVIFIQEWTVAYSQARSGLAANAIGYRWHQVFIAVCAFGILGIPAALLGAVVPLSIRLLGGSNAALGDQVGRLLTWNTVGAVVGVLVTGFVLMPLIGLRGALAALALVLLGVAGLIGLQRRQTGMLVGSAVLGVACVVGLLSTGDEWRKVVGSGVFRIRNTFITLKWIKERKAQVELAFYKDSADATVTVEKSIGTNEPVQLSLRINGKTDASTSGDLGTQYLLAHLPMMAKPEAKQVFVLGFGSGITGGALLGHPIDQLTIAENCGPVLEAGHLFNPWNRGVLTNSRTRIFNDDARAVLKLRPDRYDIIISEPSNPWVAGIGSVFSKEFYELCSSRLTERGIMAQWFHKYEMNDSIVFLVLRTFASVFPHMEIWDSQEGDLILLGSNQAWESHPDRFQEVFARQQPRADLAEIKLKSGVAIWARQIASQLTAPAIAGDGPIQTDEFPILEYAAPQAFFIGEQAHRLYFFDERTIQFTLSDRKKVEAMRTLPDQILLDEFEYYGSSNPDMRTYFAAVASKASGGMQRIDPLGHIVFRAADTYPETPSVRTNATPEFAEFLRLEAKLLREQGDWKSIVGQMEQHLTRLVNENRLKFKDFSPQYYAALATRAAIAHRDHHSALRTLRLGLVFSKEDEQLLFLSRVLDRIVPPEELQQLLERDKLKEGA